MTIGTNHQFILHLGLYTFFQTLKREAIVHIFTLSTFKNETDIFNFLEDRKESERDKRKRSYRK